MERGAILLLIFVTPAALYAISALQQLGGDSGFLPWGEKLRQLTTAFVNYSGPLDQITAASVIAVIALCVALRWGRLPAPAAFAMILLLLTFLAAPFAWKGTFGLDTRFAIMMGAGLVVMADSARVYLSRLGRQSSRPVECERSVKFSSSCA